MKVEAWCLGDANAEFMRSLDIGARAADVPVGDELFKRDPQICQAMETGDEVIKHLSVAQEADASNFVTSDGVELEVIEKQQLVEWFAENYKNFGAQLEFVTNRSQEGSQFV